MVRKFCSPVRISLALAVLATLPARAEDPREILRKSLNPRDKTYIGEQVVEDSRRPPRPRRPGSPDPVQKVYRKGQYLKIEFPTGQVLYDNGETSQLYFPRQGVVETAPSRQALDKLKAAERAIRNPRTEVTLEEDTAIAGRDCYVLSVKPPRGSQRKLWIDKATFLQLRLDETQPNGRVVSTYFRSIDFDALPTRQQLAFNLPPDVRPVEKGGGRPVPRKVAEALARRWGGPLEPRFTAGYKLRGFYRHAFKGQPMLVAVYESPDGKSTLSLFQSASMGMEQMPVKRKPPVRVLAAKKGQADLILVGSLPEEQLQRVMDSVE